MACFSKKIKTNSIEQLKRDFGEYPPKPLKTDAVAVPFTINYLNWFSLYFIRLRGVISLTRRKNDGIKSQELLEKRTEFKKVLRKMFSEFGDELSKSKAEYKSFSFIKKVAMFLAFIFVLPFIFIYIVIIAVFTALKLTNALFSTKYYSSLFGFYTHGIGLKNEVNIVNKSVKKANINLESVVSHEHLHLLQQLEGVMYDNEIQKKDFFDRVRLIIESENSEYILYLSQRHEVEARLHEMVLSFYRHHGLMPLSYEEFMGFLLANEKLQQILKHDKNINCFSRYESYAVREEEAVSELFIILFVIKDTLVISRFVKEVLSVMYSNLLHYYGDEAASKKMLESIPSTLLYEQLYGDGDIYTDSDEGYDAPLVQNSEA